MTDRQRLPNRRACERLRSRMRRLKYATVVPLCRRPPRRTVLRNHKAGSAVGTLVRDAAIILSFALQLGADIETIREALCRD